MKKIFYLYIVTNTTNIVLYIGTTSNLAKRVYQHKLLLGARFTSKYKLTKLVYFEQSEDMNEIFNRERLMKKWKRAWKEKLINDFNPKWEDLYFTTF